MIVTRASRKAAVLTDEPTAAFVVTRVDTQSLPAVAASGSGVDVRASVEILRHTGGQLPRALVGGTFTSGTGGLTVQVGSSDGGLETPETCQSHLWKPFALGLPHEFANSVMDGLLRRSSLPGGKLTVDRGGFDPVESSPLAFELAAELLAVVLVARVEGRDIEIVVRRTIDAWP